MGKGNGKARRASHRLAGPAHRHALPGPPKLSFSPGDSGPKTGLLPDPYFSATKLEWLFSHDQGLRRRAEKGEIFAGTVDSWLLFALCGVHATDPTNASRTLLFHLRDLSWDQSLCELFDIPKNVLPDVRPSLSLFGHTKRELLGAEIPVAGVLGDQQAALFGQGCLHEGEGKVTWGTGAFLLVNTGGKPVPPPEGILATVAYSRDSEAFYALEGSAFIAGAAIQWLRDSLGLIKSASETDELAQSLPENEGVYFVPALVGLGAPHWDPYARGTILGLTRGTTRAHLARAALEAIAYQTYDLLRAMEGALGKKLSGPLWKLLPTRPTIFFGLWRGRWGKSFRNCG